MQEYAEMNFFSGRCKKVRDWDLRFGQRIPKRQASKCGTKSWKKNGNDTFTDASCAPTGGIPFVGMGWKDSFEKCSGRAAARSGVLGGGIK